MAGNWPLTQAQVRLADQDMGGEAAAAAGHQVMEGNDWRNDLQPESRRRIVGKIMETLKRHVNFIGEEGHHELEKIAVRVEENIYSAATSQPDYLRKISMKMLSMETKSQNSIPNSPPPDAATNRKFSQDRVFQRTISQIPNPMQPLPVSMVATQSQERQKLLLLGQNIPNNMASSSMTDSTGLTSALAPGGMSLSTTPNGPGLDPPVPNMQVSMVASQSQGGQQSSLLRQNIPNNMASSRMPDSAGLTSALAPGGMSLSTMPNGHALDPPVQNMQNISNVAAVALQGMGGGDWRSHLSSDSRQRIVNKITETLRRHLPFSGVEGLQELNKVAIRFEEKIYSVATSQSDYLRKISLKMLTMETKALNPMDNSLPSNAAVNNELPQDAGPSISSSTRKAIAKGPFFESPISIFDNRHKRKIEDSRLLRRKVMHELIPSNETFEK